MANLSDLEVRVLDRLEEDRANPQFWSVADEIRVYLVEAMNEAMLITGEPQNRNDIPLTVKKGVTLQPLPEDIAAVTRVDYSGSALRKVTILQLDRSNYRWREEHGKTPKYWFPYGLTKIGIYPKMDDDIDVVLTAVRVPVPTARPYTGAEMVPYRHEFEDAFLSYASHVSRLKEGGNDFIQSSKEYDHFLDMMRIYSRFDWRKDDLRFTKVMGFVAKTEDQ